MYLQTAHSARKLPRTIQNSQNGSLLKEPRPRTRTNPATVRSFFISGIGSAAGWTRKSRARKRLTGYAGQPRKSSRKMSTLFEAPGLFTGGEEPRNRCTFRSGPTARPCGDDGAARRGACAPAASQPTHPQEWCRSHPMRSPRQKAPGSSAPSVHRL